MFCPNIYVKMAQTVWFLVQFVQTGCTLSATSHPNQINKIIIAITYQRTYCCGPFRSHEGISRCSDCSDSCCCSFLEGLGNSVLRNVSYRTETSPEYSCISNPGPKLHRCLSLVHIRRRLYEHETFYWEKRFRYKYIS